MSTYSQYGAVRMDEVSLPGYFTVTVPRVRPSSDRIKVQDLAGGRIQVCSKPNPDDSTTYELTRPVPLSVAQSICNHFGVSLDECRWGDYPLRWHMVVDLPLDPNGNDLIESIRNEFGNGERLGVHRAAPENQTKFSGETAPNEHGLDTLLYGLQTYGQTIIESSIKELQPKR